MNRPSLYAAFGDKRALYQQSVQRFRDRIREECRTRVEAASTLEAKLDGFYGALLHHYTRPDTPAGRGCMVLTAALVQAPVDERVREDVATMIEEVERDLTRLFAEARKRGELPEQADVRELGWMATAIHHSLSARTRAGDSKRKLASRARTAVRTLLRAAHAVA